MAKVQLIVKDSETVAKKRTMTTIATLYRNGTLTLTNTSKSTHMSKGLRGHSFFALIIYEGRVIYSSKLYYPKTIGGVLDPTIPSEITKTFIEKIPKAIAEIATGIDVIHDAGNLKSSRASVLKLIKGIVTEGSKIAKMLVPIIPFILKLK